MPATTYLPSVSIMANDTKLNWNGPKQLQGIMEAKEHRIVNIDLRQFGGSALTDAVDVPTHRREKEMPSSIPVIYVSTRNTTFLS